VVLVWVEAIGKTALLDWASGEAGRNGFATYSARARAPGAALGYGLVVQLLRVPLSRATAADRRAAFAGAAALAAPLLGVEVNRGDGPSPSLGEFGPNTAPTG
jgi:hypothetical protein